MRHGLMGSSFREVRFPDDISFIIGVVLKMYAYNVPKCRYINAPIIPFLVLVLLPLKVLKESNEKSKSLLNTVHRFVATYFVTVKYFPVLVGILAGVTLAKPCTSKNYCFSAPIKSSTQDDVYYQGDGVLIPLMLTSRKLFNTCSMT